jgi:hypothetical protein
MLQDRLYLYAIESGYVQPRPHLRPTREVLTLAS